MSTRQLVNLSTRQLVDSSTCQLLVTIFNKVNLLTVNSQNSALTNASDALGYDVCHGPCRLKIEASGDGIDVENLASKIEIGMAATLECGEINVG